MAPRKKSGADGSADTDTTQTANALQMTPGKKLKALLTKSKSVSTEMHELSGSLGQAVANAVEHDHLHRKAFSITKTLHKMEPEKLAETLAHLDYYLVESGLRERAAKVARLPMGDEQPGAQGDEGGRGLKVHEGGRGRDVAEQAGAGA